jgi:coproporphyrinogen III oxidase
MTMTAPSSARAQKADALVKQLQQRFKDKLEAAARALGHDDVFTPITWLRDDGRHGGGTRFANPGSPLFNRASINVSTVHYDDDPERKLASANAISTIIHPRHPRAPSVHMHFSWTEMRDGRGTWRLMADLNPSMPDEADKQRFAAALKAAGGARYAEASDQGDKYFNIPALERHRGVTHFYLEGFSTDDFEADYAYTKQVAEAGIDTYAAIFEDALQGRVGPDATPTDEERAAQLAYHTVYFFQVLTLDRGTTSGLLIHDQNDVGIMGSLPSHIDRDLLRSWAQKVAAPQDKLVLALADALPDVGGGEPCPVDDTTRKTLAETVRAHYRAHPEALKMQASGNVIPPTVDNHA